MNSVGTAIQKEFERVLRVLKAYDQLPTGAIGAAFIRQDLSNAIAALASGDVIEILKAYETLKNIQ